MQNRKLFTLPHELNYFILCNKKVMIDILFRSVSETLLQFGKNRKKATTEIMTIDGFEFIRGFLIHVLPKGFMKIRHNTWR